MAIKKVAGGWEYDGIVMTDKQDLIDAIEAEQADPTPKRPLPEAVLLWTPEMGNSDLNYKLAQYLMQPGNDLQSLEKLIEDSIDKRA